MTIGEGPSSVSHTVNDLKELNRLAIKVLNERYESDLYPRYLDLMEEKENARSELLDLLAWSNSGPGLTRSDETVDEIRIRREGYQQQLIGVDAKFDGDIAFAQNLEFLVDAGFPLDERLTVPNDHNDYGLPQQRMPLGIHLLSYRAKKHPGEKFAIEESFDNQ